MKKGRTKYIVVLLSSFLLFAAVFILAGGFNKIDIVEEYETEKEKIETPVFSAESGFYDEPFYLSFDVPNGMKVYYTLDCTDPDETSFLYTTPIYLENATPNENVYCMRDDVSTGFYSDLIKEYKTLDNDPSYVVPDYPVDKCNIVKAIAISPEHQKSQIITKTYFIGMDDLLYDNINIVSVTTDPKNLFDEKTGIYVTGYKFERALKYGNLGNYWRFWDANYRQKGKEWERNCCISFFDQSGKLIYEQQTGSIKVQGGVSRGTVPRSLNVFAKTSNGKQATFTSTLFNSGLKAQSVTLACGGNRLFTKFNDYFISEQCSNLNYATMEYKPYILFLEGEYWGFYWLAERYDETYLSYHYGVEEDNVLMIKNGDVECGDDVYKVLYNKMLNELTHRDMKLQSNYDYACSVIDIDSFIDYYATMAYISRQEDWPGSNFALWRTIETKNDKYSDGKWRWMMFDCNSTSMNKQIIDDNSLDFIIDRDSLFASLWENSGFKKAFQNRIIEIADICFNSDNIISFVNDYDKNMRSILQKSWERFHGKNNNKLELYLDEMEGYRKFFANRTNVVKTWF